MMMILCQYIDQTISQPLTVLKDVIICQSDYLMFDDCSENPCEDIQKYVFELGKMVCS